MSKDLRHSRLIFVYGTLQRGEQREPLWPRRPIRIRPAWVRGKLYDLGPYPGLMDGTDQVWGELWELREEDWDATVRALDAIEGCSGSPHDPYVRREVECYVRGAGVAVEASTYYLSQPIRFPSARRVVPDETGGCYWHRGERTLTDWPDEGAAPEG